MNILEEFNTAQISKLSGNCEIPCFRTGFTLSVQFLVRHAGTERVQKLDGLCIRRRNKGLHSSFTIRRMTGFPVEREFKIYSPLLKSITIIKMSKVRRAKLYFMRERSGKSARLPEFKKKLATG